MNLRNHRKYLRKHRNCIHIVATVRRQPISVASGNVPDLPAFLTSPAPRIDGISAMIVGFCAIFESS
jgi:hypothetical protein